VRVGEKGEDLLPRAREPDFRVKVVESHRPNCS
jgi:hypothetical protein